MKSLWSDTKAGTLGSDLEMRVYTSNLLGSSDDLVLHGGGNTSVKMTVDNEEILYVKGSGWDLSDIKAEGFAPVKMDALMKMAELESLSDIQMVAGQREAMIDASAPNPSVEAILHALIPYKFVDHTHADAIVTISNSKEGESHLKALFPDFLIVPYVMPGFVLASSIYQLTRGFDWDSCGGIILLNHGIFTFDDDAKLSYEKMIAAVSKAEAFLQTHADVDLEDSGIQRSIDMEQLVSAISEAKGYEVSIRVDESPLAKYYASQENLSEFATRGVLTPEHIIRTKRAPLILENDDIQGALDRYMEEYKVYFKQYATDEICLNPAPNYAVIKGVGVVLFGKNEKELTVLYDVVQHTMMAVLRADRLGGYRSIGLQESFEMEYWELEQAKLKK